MHINEFINLFESRAKCAEALGISYFSLGNMVNRGVTVEKLHDGGYVLLNKRNIIYRANHQK